MNKKALSVITATGLSWWGCGHAELLGCLIEPDRVADVGSQSTGVIEKLSVERGDVVTAGQVVAKLTAGVERASVSVAEVKAKAEAETQQAMAAHDLAQRKLERTRDLVRRDFVSDQALDQAEAEARVAEQRVEQAREAQRVAHREFQLSNAQLSQREVRSPFAGLVIERYRTEGERIEREPVVRVARIDPLRIEAIVPANQFGTISSGQVASVKTDLPGYAVLSAQVTLVDRVIDPASNSFRVRLSMPNPGNRIPSGVRCRIAFGAEAGNAPGGAPAAMAPPSAAAGQVAPARWPRQPDARPEMRPEFHPQVVTVVSHMPFLAKQQAVAQPTVPARFVSSTLKFAMAELGRTSPGKHWLTEQPLLARTSVKQGPKARPATMMAMSMRMPSPGPQDMLAGMAVMAQAVQKPQATSMAADSTTRLAAANNNSKPATPTATAPVSGLRLASVR